jgi:hypothetical protein
VTAGHLCWTVESVFVRRMHRTQLRVVIDQEDYIHPHSCVQHTTPVFTHTHLSIHLSYTVLLVAQMLGFFGCSAVSGSPWLA